MWILAPAARAGWEDAAVGTWAPSPFAERVLDLVGQIPPGRVLAYGDVALLLGESGPRQVGAALSRYGGGVPWWRVLRANGQVVDPLAEKALARLRAEGTPLRADGRTVDMARARWVPPAAELPAP
jgi:alkylated DNA nucleotide flippase Atl1